MWWPNVFDNVSDRSKNKYYMEGQTWDPGLLWISIRNMPVEMSTKFKTIPRPLKKHVTMSKSQQKQQADELGLQKFFFCKIKSVAYFMLKLEKDNWRNSNYW